MEIKNIFIATLPFLLGCCSPSSVGKQFGETKNRKDSAIRLSTKEFHEDDENNYFLKGKKDSMFLTTGYLLRKIYKCYFFHSYKTYDLFKQEVLSGKVIVSNDTLTLDGFILDTDIENLYSNYGIEEIKKRFLLGSKRMEFTPGLSYNKKMTIAYFMEKEGFFYSENSFSGKESMFSNYKKNTK